MATASQTKKPLVDYDKESDSLSIYYSDGKGAESIEIGDIIVDIDKQQRIIGIEILNACAMLKSLTGHTIEPSDLNHVSDGELIIQHVGGSTIVTFKITLPSVGTIEDSLPVPFISKKKASALC